MLREEGMTLKEATRSTSTVELRSERLLGAKNRGGSGQLLPAAVGPSFSLGPLSRLT
jgi:hypothetical protein